MQATLQRYNQLQDIIAILRLDECSEEDRQIVNRARKIERFISQPFFVAEFFTNLAGKYVKLDKTLLRLKIILNREFDDVNEQKFYLIRDLTDIKT